MDIMSKVVVSGYALYQDNIWILVNIDSREILYNRDHCLEYNSAWYIYRELLDRYYPYIGNLSNHFPKDPVKWSLVGGLQTVATVEQIRNLDIKRFNPQAYNASALDIDALAGNTSYVFLQVVGLWGAGNVMSYTSKHRILLKTSYLVHTTHGMCIDSSTNILDGLLQLVYKNLHDLNTLFHDEILYAEFKYVSWEIYGRDALCELLRWFNDPGLSKPCHHGSQWNEIVQTLHIGRPNLVYANEPVYKYRGLGRRIKQYMDNPVEPIADNVEVLDVDIYLQRYKPKEYVKLAATKPAPVVDHVETLNTKIERLTIQNQQYSRSLDACMGVISNLQLKVAELKGLEDHERALEACTRVIGELQLKIAHLKH